VAGIFEQLNSYGPPTLQCHIVSAAVSFVLCFVTKLVICRTCGTARARQSGIKINRAKPSGGLPKVRGFRERNLMAMDASVRRSHVARTVVTDARTNERINTHCIMGHVLRLESRSQRDGDDRHAGQPTRICVVALD
jgi:hypothetical protein